MPVKYVCFNSADRGGGLSFPPCSGIMRHQLGIINPGLEFNCQGVFPPLTQKMKEDAKAYDDEFGDFDLMLIRSTQRLHLLSKVLPELSIINESPRRYDDDNAIITIRS